MSQQKRGEAAGSIPPTGGVAAGKTAAEVTEQGKSVVSHSIGALTLSPEERHLRISLAAYRRA